MKNTLHQDYSLFRGKIASSALVLIATLLTASTSARADSDDRHGNDCEDCRDIGIFPPFSRPYGKSYAEWSVAAQRWALGLPVVSPSGVTHPYTDSPTFDVREGQTGQVWFLAQPFGTIERTCTIPAGKALFLIMPGSEWSSLEGFATKAEQRAAAELYFDHIVNPFCIVDGVRVRNIGAFGVESPQFTFTAPTPWIFGDVGGTGTSVAKSYHIFLAPLSRGKHTLHFGGAFHFSIAEGDDFDFDASLDITYLLTVK